MPRKARLDAPGALHHIIIRGINKTPFFKDDQDKTRLLINSLELKAGGKRSAVSDTRAAIAHRYREELGTSAAEIARHLGVTTSSIVRVIDRADYGGKRET